MMNWRIQLGLTFVASLFLTLIRPEYGNDGTYLTRFVLWFLQIGFAFLISHPVRAAVVRWLAPGASNPVQMGIVACIVALPICLFVQLLADPKNFFSNFYIVVNVFPIVIVISLTITAVYVLIARDSKDKLATQLKPELKTDRENPLDSNSESRQEDEIIDSTPFDPRNGSLYKRLSPKLRNSELLALSSEDHYVKVHTSEGSELVLMRLSDAILELESIGLKVHRSWWVARAAVLKLEKVSGKAKLVLSNGSKVPVSQSYMENIKQEGWS